MVRKKEPVNWTIDSDIIEKIKIESKEKEVSSSSVANKKLKESYNETN